jgi:hypothetical protein
MSESPALGSPHQLCLAQQARLSSTGGGVPLQLLLLLTPPIPKHPCQGLWAGDWGATLEHNFRQVAVRTKLRVR